MNKKLISSLLASLLICTGCSDDDDDKTPEVTPPEVVETESIDIKDATAINLELLSFDGATGALSFTLTDANNAVITNAQDYRITYFGFPSGKSSKPKAWKRWHVTTSYDCDNTEGHCEGLLEETSDGNYSFEAFDLDWDADVAAGSVQKYKVAIQIKGAQAENDFTLQEAM